MARREMREDRLGSALTWCRHGKVCRLTLHSIRSSLSIVYLLIGSPAEVKVNAWVPD